MLNGDFGYIRTCRDGTVFRVGKHKKWMERFFAEERYDNSSHKYFNPDNFEVGSTYTSSFEKPQGRVAEAYCYDAKLWNQFVIHNYHNDCVEAASFSTTPENIGAINFYMNNLRLLENLKKEFIPLISGLVDPDDPKNRMQLTNVASIAEMFKTLDAVRKQKKMLLDAFFASDLVILILRINRLS